jgi:hypothetical protein
MYNKMYLIGKEGRSNVQQQPMEMSRRRQSRTKARKKGRRSRDKGKGRTKEKISKEGIRKIGEK